MRKRAESECQYQVPVHTRNRVPSEPAFYCTPGAGVAAGAGKEAGAVAGTAGAGKVAGAVVAGTAGRVGAPGVAGGASAGFGGSIFGAAGIATIGGGSGFLKGSVQ